MIRLKTSLFILLCLLLTVTMASAASAHEVYFVTPEEGVAGEPVEVKLYWGHFPADPDPASSYFEQIPDGKFYVLTPEGEEITLTPTRAEDHYVASFTPATGGDFQVIFAHNRGLLDFQHGEPKGMQIVNSLAKAFIPVDGEPDIHAYDHPANLDLEVIPLSDIGHFHAGDEFKGVLVYLGQPLAGVKVEVASPAANYSHDSNEDYLELTTDAKGEFSFTADKAGTWMVKVGYFDFDKAGELDGVEHLGERYTLTTFFGAHDHSNGSHTHGTANQEQGGGTTTTILLVLAAVLALGAGVMFMRGKKSA